MRYEVLAVTEDARFITPTNGYPVDQKLNGQLVVFTNEDNRISRHNLMQMVADHGGKPQNNVTLKSTLLVNAGGPETKKPEKAREYEDRTGIRVISVNEFLSLIGVEIPARFGMANSEKVASLKKSLDGSSETLKNMRERFAKSENRLSYQASQEKNPGKRTGKAKHPLLFYILDVCLALLGIAYLATIPGYPEGTAVAIVLALIHFALALLCFRHGSSGKR